MVIVTLVLGAALLAATINVERRSMLFAVAGLALAVVWTVGFLAVRGWRRHFATRQGRDAAVGVVVGVGMFGVFVAAAWVARRIDILEGPIDDILRRADEQALGWVIVLTTVNAVAEELFFRGALLDAFTARSGVAWSTGLYVLVTAAGGNVALGVAAAVMGTVFVIERRSSHALVVPIATHLTWSLLMVTALPRS